MPACREERLGHAGTATSSSSQRDQEAEIVAGSLRRLRRSSEEDELLVDATIALLLPS